MCSNDFPAVFECSLRWKGVKLKSVIVLVETIAALDWATADEPAVARALVNV